MLLNKTTKEITSVSVCVGSFKCWVKGLSRVEHLGILQSEHVDKKVIEWEKDALHTMNVRLDLLRSWSFLDTFAI